MPTFRIRSAHGQPDELVDAERLVEQPQRLLLVATGFVMNRPRDVIVRNLRRVDVLSVEVEPT